MSIFTAARKITAARLAGVGVGAGLMMALTKDVASVCPVAAIAIVGIGFTHHKMKGLDPDHRVSSSELVTEAYHAAGEVALASAVIHLAKRGVNSLRTPKAVGMSDAVEFVEMPVTDVPATPVM